MRLVMYSLVVWPSRSRSSLTRSCRSMGIWAHKFLVVAILGYLLVFCNASIPERSSKSYYQHQQGMIDKRSESNISTNETKKAAVRSHIGSRTAACLRILYSFLSLGVRTTPDHKSGRAHLQNVASRWAKLKFWKIEFLQLFHSKSGALYVKTPHFRAAFSALHLSSTHFGGDRGIRTRDLSDVNRTL